MTPIGRVAPGVGYDTEELLDEIKLVGCHIVEITTACNIRVDAPWLAVIFVFIMWTCGTGISYLYVKYLTYIATGNDTFHFIKPTDGFGISLSGLSFLVIE